MLTRRQIWRRVKPPNYKSIHEIHEIYSIPKIRGNVKFVDKHVKFKKIDPNNDIKYFSD